MSILEKINNPSDLRALSEDKLPELAREIRSFLIEKVEKNGGHLASNLGAVELTLAIHRVFDTPSDHLIFDVGHQAYTHKLLTGRRDDFDTLRIPGGLSGFTSIKESEHDPFGAGHSSTSVSAALGFAEADRINGKDAHTVCVIGDGAYTGGMVHEALNNCKTELPLIIILNENGMSISNNRGTFASYLAKVRISEGYVRWKKSTSTFLEKIPYIGKGIKWILSKIKDIIKSILYDPNYFEDLGLYYIGPIDGHNIKKLEKALQEAKRLGKCVVVHVKTQKGKGYDPAEKFPDEYHSVSSASEPSSFHHEASEALIKLAKNDSSIAAVTAAMGLGTGLDRFGTLFPERYFDVGIAEEHALTFAAGLAANKIKPFVGIYSTFLQRAYDNIIHDIALQSLPVRLLIDRAGLAPRDGATHHGIFDVSFLSHVPNITLIAPATYGSLRAAIMDTAEIESPVAIRYSNSSEDEAVRMAFYPNCDYENYGVRADFDIAPENVFITYGNITSEVLKAEKILSDQGVSCGVVLIEALKPVGPSLEKLKEKIRGAKRALFVEEGIKNGGLGMIVQAMMADIHLTDDIPRLHVEAIDDNFVTPKEPCDIYSYVGLRADKLAEKMLGLI